MVEVADVGGWSFGVLEGEIRGRVICVMQGGRKEVKEYSSVSVAE